MAVHEVGKRLTIKGDGPVTLTAFLDQDGKIAFSTGFFGCRISPEDLRVVLAELAPIPVENETSDGNQLHEIESGEVWCSKGTRLDKVRVLFKRGERITFERLTGRAQGREVRCDLSQFLAAYQPDVSPSDGEAAVDPVVDGPQWKPEHLRPHPGELETYINMARDLQHEEERLRERVREALGEIAGLATSAEDPSHSAHGRGTAWAHVGSRAAEIAVELGLDGPPKLVEGEADV